MLRRKASNGITRAEVDRRAGKQVETLGDRVDRVMSIHHLQWIWTVGLGRVAVAVEVEAEVARVPGLLSDCGYASLLYDPLWYEVANALQRKSTRGNDG